MRTSNLPQKLVVLFLFLPVGSALLSCCTTRNVTTTFSTEPSHSPASFVININTAHASELQKLPHVGPVLARKIVEHRERYGPFRRPEHLLIIEGISEERFRELRQFINTE
ncbi:MAG: helix-hairpin-helix domain-containing protein [Acidobacteriota bacterium]